jgi:hypothetical protein
MPSLNMVLAGGRRTRIRPLRRDGPACATSRTFDLDVCSWKRGTARVCDFAVEVTDVGLGNEASEGSERANQHDDRGKKEPSHTSLRCGRWQCDRLSPIQTLNRAG